MWTELVAIGSSHSKDSQVVQAAKPEITCSARQNQAVLYSHLPAFFNSVRWKEDSHAKRLVLAKEEQCGD
jgi:hypothetical protein